MKKINSLCGNSLSDLSIIIVSWNIRELLAACLRTVYAEIQSLDGYTVETIVVDNASTDGSIELLHQQFPWVQIVQNQENVGFASANNQAVKLCNSRYILLLNPDTELKSGALDALIEFSELHPQVGAVGARILNPDGSLQLSCYPAPTLTRELWRLFYFDKLYSYGTYRMSEWDPVTPRPVDSLLGACIMLRQEVLDQIGLLDETYFMYSEEVDLCYRIQKSGWSLYWVPHAEVIHYGGQSTKQVAAEMFLRLYQGKLLYFRKHHGSFVTQLYKLVLFIVAVSRIIVGPIAWLSPSSQRKRYLTLADRYWQLVRALPSW